MKTMTAALSTVLLTTFLPYSLAWGVAAGAAGLGPPEGAGPPAWGQPGGFGGPRGILAALDLDEDQREGVRAILEEQRTEMENLRAQIEALYEELDALTRAEADELTLGAKAKEIGAVHTEMTKKRAMAEVEIRKLLTEEQKSKFDSMAAERRAGGPMKDPGKGRGPGARTE